MFKSATSYLWGSSSQTEQKSTTNSNNTPPHTSHHQSTASLPDLDELHIADQKQSHSSPNIAYHKPTPLIDIILDKDSQHKLSATHTISFLHGNSNASSHNYHNRGLNIKLPNLCAYYIVSNRNVRYLNKTDTMPMSAESKDKEPINVSDLDTYLDSLNLTLEEKRGVLTLCEWVKTEKISNKLCNELLLSEIIMTYFSSLSPTNPDLFGCWKKWIVYRNDNMLCHMNNVNALKLKAFYDTGIFSIGFDNKRRPVWFINTEYYDDSFGTDVITKAFTLWVASLLWNLAKNEFDLFACRRGISVYLNLSHWTINMASWNVIQSVKKATVAFPFQCVDIYIANIPTFMYLLKQLAAKVIVPHAMEKIVILSDMNDYFAEDKYAMKHKTPICAGGTLKVSASQWMKDRGFLDYVITNNKRSMSVPDISGSDYK